MEKSVFKIVVLFSFNGFILLVGAIVFPDSARRQGVNSPVINWQQLLFPRYLHSIVDGVVVQTVHL